MKELKITTQAIRKILNDNGMEKAGTKSIEALNNRICYAHISAPSGMEVRNWEKGKSIQVWAHTRKPGEDIQTAAKLLEDAGYVVKTQGFQCIVSLPNEEA